ncbi:hypothetical protein PMAYCL1PPCAC_05648, partial [Pristionchus mayeri]
DVHFSPFHLHIAAKSTSVWMEVVTPAGAAFYGHTLACENNEWKFTGVDTVTIPAASKVSCKPKNMGVLSKIPLHMPLVPMGKTPDGLTRWTCIDSSVKVDIKYNEEIGGRMPVHAPYIECNSSIFFFFFIITISITGSNRCAGISCEDMGAKHSACSDPWDVGGVRRGNRYECQKGFYLYSLSWGKDGSQHT